MTAKRIRPVTEAKGRGAIAMLAAFVRAYPGRSAAALACTFVAGLFDGIGMSMLLSILALAAHDPTAHVSKPEKVVLSIIEHLGLVPSAFNLCALAVMTMVLKAGATLYSNRQVGYTVAYIATDLRLSLIRAVLGARWRHYLQQSVGRLSNSVATEAQRASEAFQSGAEMAAMLLNAVIYLAIALAISWQAGVAALVTSAALISVLYSIIRTSRRAGLNQTELLKQVLGVITGQLSAAKPLKAMAREEHVDALLSDQTRKLERALRKQVIAKEALVALQDPLLAIFVVLGFYLALFTLHMPLPNVIVMLFLLARVVGFVSKSQRAYQQVVVRESAYWSIVGAIDGAREQREPAGGARGVALSRELRFEDVSFAHPNGRAILDRQSFVVPAGALTVLVGPSGAGKTTMLDLIAGLQHPDAGRILVDDVPLDEMDLRQWRRQIGYVPQESVMVDESVAYNVTLGETVPEDEIREALRAADALAFVDAMPAGIQTRVGEGGSRLSGGQRQRLAIARALIHKPRLLILDEATSNLDHEAQTAVIETVRQLKGRLTIVAVAHQERLIDAADHLYRVADGQLRPVSADASASRRAIHG